MLDEAKTIQRVPSASGTPARGALLPGRATPGPAIYSGCSADPAPRPPASRRTTGAWTCVQPSADARRDWPADVHRRRQPVRRAASQGAYVRLFPATCSAMAARRVRAGQAAACRTSAASRLVNRQHRWNWAGVIEALPFRSGISRRARSRNRQIAISRSPRPADQPRCVRHDDVSVQRLDAIRVEGGARALDVSTSDAETGRCTDQHHRKPIHEPATSIRSTNRRCISTRPTRPRAGHVVLWRDQARSTVPGTRIGGCRRCPARFSYTRVLADWRRYFMPERPITIAVRGCTRSIRPDAADSAADRSVRRYPELVRGTRRRVVRRARLRRPHLGRRVRRSTTTCEAVEWPSRTSRFARRWSASFGGRSITGACPSKWPPSSMPVSHGARERAPRSPVAIAMLCASVGAAVRGNLFGFVVLELATRARSTARTTDFSGSWGSGKGFEQVTTGDDR